MAPKYSKLCSTGAVDLRKSAENFEKCFFGTSLQVTYNHKIVMFMVWLFDNHEKHLEKNALLRMKKMAKMDGVQAREKKGESGKKKGKEKKADDSNHLQMLCYELLTKVSPLRKVKSHNCPIIIKGKNAILYFVVRDYMGSQENEFWVDVDSVETYI